MQRLWYFLWMIFSFLVHCVIQVSELWNSNIVIDCYLVSTLLRTVLKVQANNFQKLILNYLLMSKHFFLFFCGLLGITSRTVMQNFCPTSLIKWYILFFFRSTHLLYHLTQKTIWDLIKFLYSISFVNVYVTCKKFRYSKKAAKIDEISTLDLTLCSCKHQI